MGFAPRIGFAYSPSSLRNVVIRAGFGMYYDRGEYFTDFLRLLAVASADLLA